MNEILFFLHVASVGFFALLSLFISKNALITFICLQGILANLFVIKQMMLFGFNVTCSDVFAVGALLGTNLLQEHYGKEIAKKVVWLNFLFLFFYLLMSQFHLWYQPSNFDVAHQFYSAILQFMPRITVASLFTFLIVQRLDVALYAGLKKLFKSRFLLFRNLCSLICSQFVDTLMFSFLGLYGIVNSVFDIILLSFIIKICIIFSSSPIILLSKIILKKTAAFHPAVLMKKEEENISKENTHDEI